MFWLLFYDVTPLKNPLNPLNPFNIINREKNLTD